MASFDFVPAFQTPAGSPIRALFPYLSRPGMISFAGGLPASDLFDRTGIAAAAQTAWEQPVACLQYGATEGLAVLREQLLILMQQRGVSCAPQEMIVTSGSQQSFDLILRVLVAPGDIVLVEQPTYPATLQALTLHGAHIVAVPVDEYGLDTAALARMLSDGSLPTPPKLLYTVPTFSNPTGLTLSRERRIALLRLALQYGFLIVEDDPYSDLRFHGEAIPSLRALCAGPDTGLAAARDHVIHFSSLSKIVAPGLRVGWTIAAREIIQRCTIARQTADLCGASWAQTTAAAYLRNGSLAEWLPGLVDAYRQKCAAMCTALRLHFGDALQFVVPEGGMFIWARLRSGEDAQAWLQRALEENVMFVPGAGFYSANADKAGLRLSFAAPSMDQIDEGVQRLRRAWRG